LGPGGTLAARPDRGFTPGGAYSVSDVDSVSLTGGGLRLSIPLASLPPIAGGKLGVTLTATYDSKLWDVERREVRVDGTIGRKTYVVDVPRLSDRSGWKITGPGYAVVFRNAHEDFDYDQPMQREETTDDDWVNWIQRQWWRVYLVTPDGAEHELRPNNAASLYLGWDRPYLIGSYSDTPSSTGAAMRYHTTDGTYIAVLVNPNGTWEVTTPGGTRATLSADGQRITDANGNSIRIYANADNTTTYYRDEQTERELKVTQDQDGNRRVWYQAVGGAWQHVDVNVGTTRVQGKLYRTKAWNPSGQTEIGGQGVECVHDAVLNQEVPVFREIVFPATEPGEPGRRYSFEYNSDTTEQFPTNYREVCGVVGESRTFTSSLGLGELSRMTTPAGAVVDYAYSETGKHRVQHNLDEITGNLVKSKTVSHDGVTDTWTYDISPEGRGGAVLGPDGSISAEAAWVGDPRYGYQVGSDSGLAGHTFRSLSGNVLVERRWGGGWAGSVRTGPSGTVVVNPVVEAEYTSLIENGVPVRMSAKKFEYDYNGNLLRTKEFDWFDPTPVVRDAANIPVDVPANATLLRETNTSYYNTAPDAFSPNLYVRRATSGSTLVINAQQEGRVTGGAVTRYSYDEQGYGVPPLRGNPTSVQQLDSATGAWSETKASYGAFGNKETSTDASGNVTKYFYEDATHALPTRIQVDPKNGTGAQETHTTYDFHTGLVTSNRDANGNQTDYDYTNLLLNAVDPLGRAGAVRGPIDAGNGGQRRTVKTYYHDKTRIVRTEADLSLEGDGLLKTRTTSDQLGRVVLSEQSEDGVNHTVSVLSHHEQGGRVTFTSNPRRQAGAPTDGWTRTTRDSAGRVTEVATFSGPTRPAADVPCNDANCTGRMKMAYYAEYTTVTDQAGKQRRSVTDALGRLSRVDEPNSSGTLGDMGTPAQPTCYSYDALSNLTQVRQGGEWQPPSQDNNGQCIGGQTRTFLYSTLSRLTSAENPESGKILYEYYPNGNLKRKTDPRKLPGTPTHVEVSYNYDGLNRVTSSSYNDGTPKVSYYYDSQALPAGAPELAQGPARKGNLLAVIYGEGSTAGTYYGYDGLGRVTSSAQRTDAGGAGGVQTYTMPEYRYDLAGNLTAQTYPSGRVVKSEYDAAGRLAGLRDGAAGTFYAGGSATDDANRIAYTAHGAASAMRLGNGLRERALFNSRLQATELGVRDAAGASDLLKLNYTFATLDAAGNSLGDNNGNVRTQTMTVPGLAQPLVQSYRYDELNRLGETRETSGQTEVWRQTFRYDRYGNRRFDAAQTTLPAITPENQLSQNPTISEATNRLDGYGHDLAGNMITDAHGRKFEYDAENRQVSFDANPQTVEKDAAYFYDGDGRRVKKVAGGITTVFVYDVGGRLVAEYANQPQSTAGGTSYVMADHLGSTRLVTDAHGGVRSRHDYVPFGEEVYVGRNIQGYGNNVTRQKFTGYQRDDESGLDFAQARYYSSALGRFTSVDPLLESGRAASPKTWNRYAYALNNPLRYTDPTGLLAADFYDRQGNKIGTDGVDDNKVYLLNEGKEVPDMQSSALRTPLDNLKLEIMKTTDFTEVGGLIILERTKEGKNFTDGKFNTVGGEQSVEGDTVEPAGPDTTERNKDKRIPAGVYDLSNHSGPRFKDTFVMSNQNVPKDRAILFHVGNSGDSTTGCIVPGLGKGNGTLTGGSSKPKMEELKAFVKAEGASNVKLIIRNKIASSP
jgi:RHS repeat-associated protein